ncbi:WD40-repeat-containing domain protein [Phakopsora pachyrhizi]|nr:WD40-repeat-containing domain protein [Phakopsora pachyrhizi]
MAFKPISHWSPNPSTGERGCSIKLNSDKKSSIVYSNGKAIYIKDVDRLDQSKIYKGHTNQTTVAKFSPSGNYVGSGDVSGTVRVWGTVGEDQILKIEVKAIGGKINDLAWDEDNGGKRIIAVGEGRERFGHAFSIDGGNSVGEIAGHSKPITSVSIRPIRPYRAVTASDDTTLGFFHATPYKYNKNIQSHKKFVQAVEYSPDGSLFASGGSDTKLFIYDGSTGDIVDELGSDDNSKEKHSGTVFSIAWSLVNHSHLASFSADTTVRLWDASNRKQISSWNLASSAAPEKHQVGGTWLEGNRLVSLSYNGDLTVIDTRHPEPVNKIEACQRGIISVAKSPVESGYYVGDHSGRVMHYSTEGKSKTVGSKPDSNIIALSASKTKVFSVGLDDLFRAIDPTDVSYDMNVSVPLGQQPKGLQANSSNDIALTITSNEARLIESGNSLTTIPLKFDATACAMSSKFAAIGFSNGKVGIYDCSSKTLKELGLLESNKTTITSISISPDESLVGVGEQSGKILVYELISPTFSLKISSQWCFHSARILSLSWRECSRVLASSSLDTNIYIWNILKPMKNLSLKSSHVGGTNQVLWEDSETLLSAGADGSIRKFKINLESFK